MSSCYELPIHPLVELHWQIEDVKVRALIDTGSMKYSITKQVHAVLDFDNLRIRPETMHARNVYLLLVILNNTWYSFNACVMFNNKFRLVQGEFLVCDNISYVCVLGWDFLVQNRLDLRGITLGDRWAYSLVGNQGKTPIIANHVAWQNQLSGVVKMVETRTEIAIEDGNPTLFVESQLKGKITATNSRAEQK